MTAPCTRDKTRLLHEVRSYRRKCVELSLWELSGEHSRPHVNNALASSSAGTEGVALPLMPARKVAVAGGNPLENGLIHVPENGL